MAITRAAFAVTAAAALVACGGGGSEQERAIPLTGGTQTQPTMVALDRIDVVDGGGLLTADREGKFTRIRFAPPADRVDATRLHLAERLGETANGVLVMVDEYGSRDVPGGADCSEGVETFVRVFSLPLARELTAIVAGSCLDGRPAKVPAATWLDDDRLAVAGTPRRIFTITDAGAVTLQ